MKIQIPNSDKTVTLQEFTEAVVIKFLKDESHFITIPDLVHKVLTHYSINTRENREKLYADINLALRHLVEKQRVREYYTRMTPKHLSFGHARFKAYKLVK